MAEQQNVDYLDKYGWMGDYCSRCRIAVDELPQLYCDLLTNEYLSNQQEQKVEVLADKIGVSRRSYFRKKQAALVAFALECQYLPNKQGTWKRLVVW